MKTKGLVLVSCLVAAALMASPALGEIQKKTARSSSKSQSMAPRTAQVAPTVRHTTNSRQLGARQYAGTRQYMGARQYASTRYNMANRQYAGNGYYTDRRYSTHGYYGGSNYYTGNGYYGGGWRYSGYYGGGWGYPNYGYYSSWPSSYYYGGYGSGYYPYSYYGGNPNGYSYYQPGYSSDGSTVAAVQRRLGELGHYHGLVDGVIGPQTQTAIAAFESTHGMVTDGMITTRLLNRIGLA